SVVCVSLLTLLAACAGPLPPVGTGGTGGTGGSGGAPACASYDFAPAVRYPVSSGLPFSTGIQSIATGDLNGDGEPDLAVVNDFFGKVSVLLNQGGGTYGHPVNHAAGGNAV